MYQLDSPYYLYLLIIIPILLMINIIYMVWRKKTQENFSSRELLEKYDIDGNPKFKVFNKENFNEIKDFVDELDLIVIKPCIFIFL